MGDGPARITAQSLDEILPSSSIGLEVEKFGVGIAFPQISDPGALLSSRSFQNCPTQPSLFELSSKVKFRVREFSSILCLVKSQDDFLCHVQFHFCV